MTQLLDSPSADRDVLAADATATTRLRLTEQTAIADRAVKLAAEAALADESDRPWERLRRYLARQCPLVDGDLLAAVARQEFGEFDA